MRHISFFLTTPQFKSRTKHVTRRLGWKDAKPGDVLMAVEKGQGLKRGEKVKKLGPIKIVSVRRERLDEIDGDDVRHEGFPILTPRTFIEMFCEHNGCNPADEVTRLEFEYL